LLSGKRLTQLTHASDATSPLRHHFAAGSIAGGVATLVTTPTELVKVRMQTQRLSGQPAQYRNSLQCAVSVLRSHGLSGLYRGFRLNAFKDSFANGVYFYTYHLLSQRISSALSAPTSAAAAPTRSLATPPSRAAKTAGTILGGGCAGVFSWTLVHPLDVIKSVLQAQSLDVKPSPLAIAQQGWRQGGFRFLFRGWCANTTRAFPCCAVAFLVYDNLLGEIQRRLVWDI